MEPHRSNPPAKANFSGCFIAIGIVLLLAIVAVVGIYGFFRVAVKENHHSTAIAQASKIDGTVILQESDLNSYSATDFGESLTKEHYIAVAVVDDMTSLGKKMFADKANGMAVQWMVRVNDIQKSDSDPEKITGQFELPYRIRKGNSTSGSSVRINAEFASSPNSRLFSLRKGDWVQISGDIRFTSNSKSVFFDNALIVEESPVETDSAESAAH